MLDPITLAVFGQVGQACRDAVLRSPELSCAGRTVGGEFRVEDFVESVKWLAWAKDNGCRWDAHTGAAVAQGGRLEVLQWAWENGCPWDPYTLRALREACPKLRALWDEAAPVTLWEGVDFGYAGGADAGQVVGLRLQSKGLTGDLPAELGRLTALKSLFLDGNKLRSVPAVLGRLTALEMLDLRDNKLTSVPAACKKGGALEQSGCRIHRRRQKGRRQRVTRACVALAVTSVAACMHEQMSVRHQWLSDWLVLSMWSALFGAR